MLLKESTFELIAIVAIFHFDLLEWIIWRQVQINFFDGVIFLIVIVDRIVVGELNIDFFL